MSLTVFLELLPYWVSVDGFILELLIVGFIENGLFDFMKLNDAQCRIGEFVHRPV